eukprot:265124-Amphidinium_carterae.1
MNINQNDTVLHLQNAPKNQARNSNDASSHSFQSFMRIATCTYWGSRRLLSFGSSSKSLPAALRASASNPI